MYKIHNGGYKVDKKVQLSVYGGDQIRDSCVGDPGSKDTSEWLPAAIGRKYVDDNKIFKYIDIDSPPEEEKHQKFVKRMFDEDLFYPIVFVNDEMVAEGIPRLKTIYKQLDQHNVQLQK